MSPAPPWLEAGCQRGYDLNPVVNVEPLRMVVGLHQLVCETDQIVGVVAFSEARATRDMKPQAS